MKSILLLVIASVLSVAAHADPKTNCDAKIKELEDDHKASGQGMHGGMAHDFKVKWEEAKRPGCRRYGQVSVCCRPGQKYL